jgi:hypothetical protein
VRTTTHFARDVQEIRGVNDFFWPRRAALDLALGTMLLMWGLGWLLDHERGQFSIAAFLTGLALMVPARVITRRFPPIVGPAIRDARAAAAGFFVVYIGWLGGGAALIPFAAVVCYSIIPLGLFLLVTTFFESLRED